MSFEREKELAAAEAVKFIESGMTVGLGSGSTAAYAVRQIGEKVLGGLSIVGVPSSQATANLANSVGIPLKALDEVNEIDLNIDGADEFDSYKNLIKGGGGALLREKIIAFNSNKNLIIVDSRKRVSRLGTFLLPIEVIPFSTNKVILALSKLELSPVLRMKVATPYITDEGNFILDIDISGFSDIRGLDNDLRSIPGIVETGLFINLATNIFVGEGDNVTIIT